MDSHIRKLPPHPGTYALLLELHGKSKVRVGRLGLTTFDAPVYLYSGSAFGPGGLPARLTHHLGLSEKPHWHIDYLRSAATVSQVWTTTDPRRLECAWAAAARSLRGAREVIGFGASDCRCASHLVELPRIPKRSTFRRYLRDLDPSCSPISQFSVEPRVCASAL